MADSIDALWLRYWKGFTGAMENWGCPNLSPFHLQRSVLASEGTVILSAVRTREGRISNQDSLRLEVQAPTGFLPSKKIGILNVDSPRESKEPAIYGWIMLRFFLVSGRFLARETRNALSGG
jgi:hypothetical protein